MTDSTISNLPAGAPPVGADIFAGVQGGVTVKITYSQLLTSMSLSCLRLDGTNAPSANISLAGFKFINSAAGVASTDLATIGQLAVPAGASLIGFTKPDGSATTLDKLATSAGAGMSAFSHAQTYTAGTSGAKGKQRVEVKDSPYSAVGDNVANDTAALQSADLGTSAELILNAGTYLLNLAAGQSLLTNAGAQTKTGYGVGGTVLNFTRTDTAGTVNPWISPPANMLFRDTAIKVTEPVASGNTDVLFSFSQNNLALSNISIDGQTVLNGSTQDRTVQLVKSDATANWTGLLFNNVKAKNLGRIYTRDNTDATADKSIKVFGGDFSNIWRTAFTFNAPGGSIEDVEVAGATFRDHAGIANNDSAMGGNNNAVGLVGTIGARVSHCHVSGQFGSLVHVEENANGGAIFANTTYVKLPASTRGAIEFIANNVSGTPTTPKNFSIMGNGLRSADGVGKGIYVQSGVSKDGLNYSTIVGNVVTEFDRAVQVDTEPRSLLISSNVLSGVSQDVNLARATLNLDGNLVVDCAGGITLSRGGLIGKVRYVNLASAIAAITAFATSTTGPASLTGWTWETDLFDLVNGTTDLIVGPMATRLYGKFSIAIVQGGTIYRNLEWESTYDGVTLTNTSKLSYGSGTITSLTPVVSAGKLTVELINGSGGTLTNCRLQIMFHGGQFIV